MKSDKASLAIRLWFRLKRVWRPLLAGFEMWMQRKRWRVNASLGVGLFLVIVSPTFSHSQAGLLWDCLWNRCSPVGWVVPIVNFAIAVVVFAVAFWYVAWIARTIVWSRLEVVNPSDNSCRVLIMGLSEELVPVGDRVVSNIS